MSDTAATETAKAVKHASKAAEAFVEPAKDVLAEVSKAKWITPRSLLIAGVVILVSGTAVVAVRKVQTIKAAKQAAQDEEN